MKISPQLAEEMFGALPGVKVLASYNPLPNTFSLFCDDRAATQRELTGMGVATTLHPTKDNLLIVPSGNRANITNLSLPGKRGSL